VAGGVSDIAFRAQLLIPEQRQLYDYWVEKSANGGLPLRRDISPMHFPKLLPFISLIEVEPDAARFKVRLAGTRLREIYDRETTGLYLDEIDWGDKHDYWMASYAHLVKDGKPAQGTIRGPRVQKEHLVQYWLRLPLSLGGASVGMILCYDAFLSAIEEETQADASAAG
jgi:PAS domain